MIVRTRHIRSGNFGGLKRQAQPSNVNSPNSGVIVVNRTYIPLSYNTNDEHVSIDFNLSYTIHKPELLSSAKKPLILIHGGPGIPSNYLKPLASSLDRCVIVYDQLGCGNSSEPCDLAAYSIPFAVDDLEALVRHLGLKSFHLFGHSFGGILAFEFAKRLSDKGPRNLGKCLSVTLCSTPFNINQVDKESQAALSMLEDAISPQDATSLFHRNHVCRTADIPRSLQESYSKRGKVWQGTEVIQDYVATGPSMVLNPLPPVLLTRGEYDFVSQLHAFDEWADLFSNNFSAKCKRSTLLGCSHYSMLEDQSLSCRIIEQFLSAEEQHS